MKYVTRGSLVLLLIAAGAIFAAGCGKQAENDPKQAQVGKDKDKDKDGDNGHGWWCEEHGIPEADCIMCSEKLKNEAKAKGDWCKHNRAKSQCFECNPQLKEEFAAKYRAKYPGKEPPRPTDYD